MVFCTLANAGRKLATANPVGAGGAAAAWPRAASEPRQAPLTTSRVKTASLDDRGDGIILSPDDNGAGAVATCGAFDGLGMLRQNKGCRCLCGPVAQLGARFHGMEEVTGSIPVRSTTLTPAESKSYSSRSEEQNQKQGHKKGTIKNTIVRDQRKKSNAHWNDQWAFLQFSVPF